jgi:hypothetical protein
VSWQGELSLVGRGSDGTYQNLLTLNDGFNISGTSVKMSPITVANPSAFELKIIGSAP